jgi:predicted nucleotidyltransferase
MQTAEVDGHIGLPANAISALRSTLEKHPAIKQVTLYGSRAKGNFRYNSDIDLMVCAPDMGWAEFNQLAVEIDDLLLPWKVDLALQHQVENTDLLDHVARVGILFYSGSDPNAFG